MPQVNDQHQSAEYEPAHHVSIPILAPCGCHFWPSIGHAIILMLGAAESNIATMYTLHQASMKERCTYSVADEVLRRNGDWYRDETGNANCYSDARQLHRTQVFWSRLSTAGYLRLYKLE